MPLLKVSPVPPSFIDLCHYAWGIPALAEIARDGGAKLVTVSRRLQIASETTRRTIQGLVDLDLVMPNPGYGHPMRPEYLLTPDGESIGRPAVGLWKTLQEASDAVRGACRRKWTLPCLVALEGAADRFSELEAALSGVSPRALAQALESAAGAGLVSRRVDAGPPVRTLYALTPTSRGIAGNASALATAMVWGDL